MILSSSQCCFGDFIKIMNWQIFINMNSVLNPVLDHGNVITDQFKKHFFSNNASWHELDKNGKVMNKIDTVSTSRNIHSIRGDEFPTYSYKCNES